MLTYDPLGSASGSSHVAVLASVPPSTEDGGGAEAVGAVGVVPEDEGDGVGDGEDESSLEEHAAAPTHAAPAMSARGAMRWSRGTGALYHPNAP